MPDDLYKKLEEIKSFYKTIVKISCPVFDGTEVYFHMNGFNHLIRKGKNLRPLSHQISRLKLIKFIPEIIKNSHTASEYKKIRRFINDKSSEAHFWSIEATIEGIKVIIIIRQINNGNKHFFSVMEKNYIKNTKDP